MTDKERILFHIIDQLSTGATLGNPSKPNWSSEGYRRIGDDGYYAHFAPWKKAEVGDIVLCETCHPHFAKVGIVQEPVNPREASCLLKELGGDRLMNMSNEGFRPIVGLDLGNPVFLYGSQRELYAKVIKAFRRGDEHPYRFGGFSVDGDSATVVVRPHIWYAMDDENKPFRCTFKWNAKTTIKRILACMVKSGYGSAWSKKKKA